MYLLMYNGNYGGGGGGCGSGEEATQEGTLF